MAAYVVITRTGPIHNEAEMAQYQRLTMAAPPVDVEPLALYGETEALEGPAPDGLVILKFKTKEAARAWYSRPEYQDAARHRQNAAPYTITIVEGL